MPTTTSTSRICVLYQFFEASPTYRENLLHFLAFGLSPAVDYYFVLSGDSNVELPRLGNLRQIRAPNLNNDFGAFTFALHSGQVPIQDYEFFIFVNSSVRGPYTPAYSVHHWTSAFTRLLTADVGIAGSTICIPSPANLMASGFQSRHGGTPPFSHVQSMAFAMRRPVLEHLMTAVLRERTEPMKKSDVVADYEMLMSQTVIRQGLNIKCLLPEYNQIDYRLPHVDINPTADNGDPQAEGGYFGRTIHPFEAIFVKANRRMHPLHFLDKITHSMIEAQKPFRTDILGEELARYLDTHAARVPFSVPMPSMADQESHRRLGRIVSSINSILNEPSPGA